MSMVPGNQADDRETLSRLRWQCRRGMLELDLLLQPFVESYSSLSIKEQDAFKLLLAYPDQELLGYLMGYNVHGNKDVANVTTKIRQAVTN